MSSTMDKIKDTLHLNKDHQKTAISTTDSHRPGTLGNDAARVPRYANSGAGTGPNYEKSSTGGYVDTPKDNLSSKENQYDSNTAPLSTSYLAPGLNSPVGSTRHDNITGLGHNTRATHEDGSIIDKAKNVLNLNKDNRQASGTGSQNPSESHGQNYITASGHPSHAGTGNVDSSFIDKAKNALNLNKDNHQTYAAGSQDPTESHGYNYTSASGHQNRAGTDNSVIDKAKNALKLKKDNHDGSGSVTGQNYTTGSGYTSHSAAGNDESYKDRVKNALHLGHDNQDEMETDYPKFRLPPKDAIDHRPFRPDPIETTRRSNHEINKAKREEQNLLMLMKNEVDKNFSSTKK